MELQNKDALYERIRAKDSRFDGYFFVAVSSTGIYCRPVCRARTPKKENCIFYRTAAECEEAGFRPCMLCRPELAPGVRGNGDPGAWQADASISPGAAGAEGRRLADTAAEYIKENCGEEISIARTAAQLGVSERHLRRVFEETYHVTPTAWLRTCRLHLAKNLLTRSGISVTDAACAAGFGSLRRFNEVFREKYHMTPTQLRKAGVKEDGYTLGIGYRGTYPWSEMLAFLGRRAIPRTETVRDGVYMRVLRVHDCAGDEHFGTVEVSNAPARNMLEVKASETLLAVMPRVLSVLRRMFDTDCDPGMIWDRLRDMDSLPGAGISGGKRIALYGVRVPGCADPFEMAVRAVLGQQVTVQAATTLCGRVAAVFGRPVETGIEGLTAAFPSAEDILALPGDIADHLGPLGVTSRRARTILELARFFAGEAHKVSEARAVERLLEIPGIGPWTANYIAMRAFGSPDAFLPTDYGVKKAMNAGRDRALTAKEMEEIAEAWRPWRSYAVFCLWNSLG